MSPRARAPSLLAFVAGLALLPWAARADEAEPTGGLPVSVIPRPVVLERGDGAFVLDEEARVVALGADVPDLVADHLARGLGVPRGAGGAAVDRRSIRLGVSDVGLGDEGYRLTVTPGGVELRGPPAGLFRGAQTLLQLARDGRIPALRIEDRPRFAWRGLHLDVGRHFFPVDEVKRYIDLLAFFKMNTFHWHLTEDQGWRIEIKGYPKLTEVGAWRAQSPKPGNRGAGDGTPHGGFYTQEEIREVVAYAKERFVTIVPEIEMPGHAQAAIAAYPELGNTDETLDVRTRWGVSKHVYNVEEATFTFLENVLTEVMDLFPGTFIHVGGDECPKDEWKASPRAQARMKAEGLEDEHELQSWFVRRIERFLAQNGRRLIGWDEIQEGGLPPRASMMVWRSWATESGVEAVKAGHDIVMSPTSHCYFDYYQGDPATEPEAIGGRLPLERVYAFEPVPEGLTEAEARRVLGAQGNLWTEYIPTFDHLTYMAYPRGAALAEVVWSPPGTRNLEDFLRRWDDVRRHLDARGIRYRQPPPPPEVPPWTGVAPALEPGLRVAGYLGSFDRVPSFEDLEPAFEADVEGVGFTGREPQDAFALRFTGFLRVERTGPVELRLGSDDGSVLFLNGVRLVANDGLHGYAVVSQRLRLEAGLYPLEIGYFEQSGAQRLDLAIEGPAALFRPVTEGR